MLKSRIIPWLLLILVVGLLFATSPVLAQQPRPSCYAAPLGTGVLIQAGLNVHAPGDPDYYAWTAARTGDVLVDIRFTSEQGDLDLVIQDAQGQTLAQSTKAINRRYAEFRALAPRKTA